MLIQNREKNQQDELLTVQEVADYLRVRRVTVWRWCKQGVIPAFQVGRNWRIHRADLLRLSNSRQNLAMSTSQPDSSAS